MDPVSQLKTPDTLALEARVAELEEQNEKLSRINQVLIERMETGSSNRSAPYAAFEHSVVLAEQVRERTEELNVALGELQVSNQALQQANQQAATAHNRLVDAIESISDAFALYDKDRKLVLSNRRYCDQWAGTGITISEGINLDTLRQLAREHGLVVRTLERTQAESGQTSVHQLRNGHWMQVSERATHEGGLVVLHTDITELKQIEKDRRERELAQKSLMLQNAVSHLSQGVALVSDDGKLEVCNDRFRQMARLSEDEVADEPVLSQLLESRELVVLTPDSLDETGVHHDKVEQTLSDGGPVIEVRTHALPSGGYVNTYTDITERYMYAETLRESEQWIRLITDNVPALIAYVGNDLCFQFTNKVYDKWYHWPPFTMLGKHIREVHGESQFSKLEPYLQKALSGQSQTFEIDELNADGQLRYLLKSYVPNIDLDGRCVGVFVLVQDITERRETAEALQSAYSHLEHRVTERTRELTNLNAQLRQEIIERKAIEARLLEAKGEAEQANLSKTKFLAAVSHDLLQPLNAARLFAGALFEKGLTQECNQLCRSLGNSLDDVESLLGTLVDISKLDAGAVEPDFMDFPANELLDNIANEYKRMAASEGLDLAFVSSSVVIRSDSQLLARILRNFLSNAIRYTEEGRILFGCRRKSRSLVIEVWDTGQGIPEAQLDDIFQEFKRLKSSSHKDKGLGLGLAIVDKIATVLKHRINVGSVEGRGSVFSVEVPLGTLAPAPELVSMPVQPVASRLNGAYIWVIDNDPAICQGMERLMDGWGCDVLSFGSMTDLEEQVDLGSDEPELLIVDYHLDDGETGLDLADSLKNKYNIQSPVLMITANHDRDLNQHIREQGHFLLNKPIKPLKLKMTLTHMLES